MIKSTRDEIKAKGFTVYSNEIHHNKVLSMKAKYLLMLILSLPESYSISVPILMNFTGEKRTSIKSAMEELVEEGFLVLGKQSRDENGQMARGYDCEVFEVLSSTDEIAKNVDMTPSEPRAEKPHAVKPHAEKQQHINTINNKDYLKTNTIISPDESEVSEKSKSKTKKQPLPGNSKSPSVEGKASKLADLFKETGGMGEATAESMPDVSTKPPVPTMTASSLKVERIVKAIMKEYSHLDFEILERSIQLAFEKEISDTKSFIAYVLTILSDWNAHDFTTIDKVEKHLKRISNKAPDLTLRRYEMKPDWLANLDNIVPYDPNRKFNSEEQKKIDHMKQLQSQLLDFKAVDEAEANLPF